MKFATHMNREELFDISDVIARLNEVKSECLEHTSDIKVKFPRLVVADVNGDRLGVIKDDGTEFIFVPQVKP